MNVPVLYSFRRCPYAMRARIAISVSAVRFELREILLKEKPPQMLDASIKGTVPVAVFANDMVIEESLELMLWSLAQNDPYNWLDDLDQSLDFIHTNDMSFKPWLDRYKYHVGYPDQSQADYRDRCGEFLIRLEQKLSPHKFLLGNQARLADVAVFPFIRQFAFVDKEWFDDGPYPHTRAWLDSWVASGLFASIMHKYAPWQHGASKIFFPDHR